MTITDWIIASAVLVALFGERIWKWKDNKNIRSQINTIVKSNLWQLRKDLIKKINITDKILEISETWFSEISGYYFLFEDLIIPNINVFNLTKYPNTIEFFNHYKINIQEIRNRFKSKEGMEEEWSHITKNTYKKLIERLDEAITEFERY